jgi:hypothetical protein
MFLSKEAGALSLSVRKGDKHHRFQDLQKNEIIYSWRVMKIIIEANVAHNLVDIKGAIFERAKGR